jgi:hypothetical protein
MLACSLGAPAPTQTPEPTNTPKPTATTAPTETPEPTQTPLPEPTKESAPTESADEPGQLGVAEGELGIDQVSGWADESGYWVVSGLVINKMDRAVDNVEIEVEIFDANDQSLYKETTYTSLWTLAPGETSPFSLSIYEELANPDHFVATIVGNGSADVDRGQVAIENTYTQTDEYGTMHITGEVVNTGDQPVIVENLAGALFDEAGELLSGYSYSYKIQYIEPGDRSPFMVNLYIPPDTDPATFELYVAANVTQAIPVYDLQITQENVDYIDAYGSYHLVGEVANGGNEPLSFSIYGVLKNAEGQILDFSSGYIAFYGIQPGESIPFDIAGWSVVNYQDNFFDENTGLTYSIAIDPYSIWEGGTDYETLSSKDVAGTFDGYSAKYTGTVVNSTNTEYSSVVVQVALYDKATNQVVAVNYTYLSETLPVNGEGAYEMYIYLPSDFDLDSVNAVVTIKAQK